MCFSTGFVGWLFCAGGFAAYYWCYSYTSILGMLFGKQLVDFLAHGRRVRAGQADLRRGERVDVAVERAGAVEGVERGDLRRGVLRLLAVRSAGAARWWMGRSLVPLVLLSFVALLSLFVFAGQASAVVAKPSAIALTTPSSSPGNDTTPTFTVTVGETGGTVTLYSDSSCTTSNAISSATSVTDTDSPFTVAVTANTLSAGTYTVYAKHTEGGEDSDCSTATASYVLDTTAPTVDTTDTKYYSSVSRNSTTHVVTFSDANALGADSVRVTGEFIHARVKFSEDVKGNLISSDAARPSIWRVIGNTETQFGVSGRSYAGSEAPASDNHCSPADGANTPFVTGDWICSYRVKTADLGKFKIRVKTTTTDVAGNALAQQYDHSTTIQLNKPAAPSAIVPENDTSVLGSGSTATDKITKELAKVKVTLPTSASPTGSSTLQVFTYTPETDGSCATPTGSNNGWTDRGTTTGATATGGSPNYVTSTRVWTSNTLSAAVTEGKYCFTARYDIDGSGTSNVASSYAAGVLIELDTTAPTVTAADTKYYSSSTLTTENELANGSYRKQGQDIYTKVKFSENMFNDNADSAALPRIHYVIGAAATEYDIVAHSAALADGDCKAKSSTDTSEYLCRYTVASNVNGAFGLRVETTNTFDVADNQLASQYIHSDTLTLDTTAPTVTSADTKYYSDSNLSTELTNGSYRKAGESVYTKVKFSENVINTNANGGTARPSLWHVIGSNETQYDIVAHDATLADGDCKAKGSDDTSEYTCMYTTASNANGAFKVRVKTDTQDLATNALGALYDHSDTINLDTTAPTVTGTIATTGENTVSGVKYLNANDTITLTLTLTENIQTTNPIVQFKDGTSNLGTPITTTGSGTTREAQFTVASGQNVSNGNLKWDITNESSVLDNAGNALVAVAAQDISNTVIDTTPPAAPTALDLATADDSCADFDGVQGCDFGSNTDDRTNNTTGLTISFSGEQYATVNLTKAKNPTGTQTTAGTPVTLSTGTTGSTDIALSEGDGTYTVLVNQTDRAQNVSVAAFLEVTIDTTAPTAPPTPDLQAASDTGVSSTDNLTKDATVNFDLGSHTNAEECRYVYEGSNVTGNSGYACVAAADDAYTNTTEREESFKTRAYDLAGNHADSATALSVHFDRSIDEALIDLKATSDSGYSSTDNITNVTEPTVTLSQLESSADPTTGTGKAQVTINLWDDVNFDDAIVSTELTQVGAIPNVSSNTQDLQLSALAEDIHKLVAVHTDDAGNEAITAVNKLAYNPADGTKGSNVIIVDTTAPQAPSKPDLSPNRDTYGANANPSRDGTNADDVTYYQDLLFFTEASKRNDGDSQDLTQAALIREQHHLLAYELNAADSSSATATSITGQSITINSNTITHSNPGDTAARTIASQQNYLSQTVAGQQHTHRFAGATEDTENQYHIATKQVDAAGNTSDYGPTLSLKIDRKAPNEAPGELILHFDSDTGISMTDRRTANTTPVFITEFPRTRQLEGESTDTDYQVDYYELWRAGLDNNYETEGAFAYPSDSTQQHQASFELIPDTKDATNQLSDTTSSNPLLDVYENGISVRIIQQNIPQYNKHYSYKMVSVDLAGNTTLGVDESNPEILVPPPTPSDPDLATASDTGSSSTDNLTKNTTLTLATTYKNTSSAEQQGQAAQNLNTLEITITPPNNGDPQTLLFSRPADHNDGDGFDIPTGERRTGTGETSVPDTTHTDFTATYSFSTAVDLTQVFGEDLQDGTYTLSFLGINSQGERGLPSNELTVTLDTTAPVVGEVDDVTTDGREEGSTRFLKGGGVVKLDITLNDHDFTARPLADITADGVVIGQISFPGGIGADLGGSRLYTGVLYAIQAGENGVIGYRFRALTDDAGNVTPAQEEATALAIVADTTAPTGVILEATVTGENNVQTVTYHAVSREQIASEEGMTTKDAYAVANCVAANAAVVSDAYVQGEGVSADATNGRCFRIKDRAGNLAFLHTGRTADVKPLFDGLKLHPEDNTGVTTDQITSNSSPRFTAITIPGVTATLSFTKSGESEPTTTTSVTAADFDTDNISMFTTGPVSLPEGEYTVTGSVTMGGATIATTETLQTVTIDTTAPTVSLALHSAHTTAPYIQAETPVVVVTSDETGDGVTGRVFSDAACQRRINLSIDVDNIFAVASSETDVTLSIRDTGFDYQNSAFSVYALVEDVAGNGVCTTTPLEVVHDGTAPTVTVVKVGSGSTAQYVATAADANPTTARYKDNEASSGCTTSANTAATGWADYTGTLVSAHDTNGLCVIFTDAAGNKVAQHVTDSGSYTNSIGGFAISDDTGVESDDFVTNNPSQTLSAVTVPGSEGSLILTNKADTNQVITLPFTASNYSESQPSQFSVSTTIPEGSYTVTAEVTIDNTPVSGIALQDPLIVDTTAPSAPETANPYSLTSSNDSFKVDGIVRAGFTYVSASIGVASAPYSVGSTTQHFLTLFGADYPCTYSTSQANSGVNESDSFNCSINYTVDATTPQGVAAITMRGTDIAGNAYSFTISDDDAVVYTVDTIAPEYTVTASKTAAKPGDTVTVTVDAEDLHGVLLNGSAVSDDNQMRVSFAGEQFSLNTLPDSFDYTVPDDALDGQRTLSLPQITDRVGNAAAPSPQGVLFIDTKTPSVSQYLFSNSGTTLSVSAQIARNNHSSMPGEEGVTLSFTGACSSFPTSPVFTASAQAAPERYSYSIRIPRGTYSTDTCSIIATDAVGNQSDPTLTTIPLTITASRSGGGGGGGGSVGVVRYDLKQGAAPAIPEQVGTPLPPEEPQPEQQTLTRNLTIGSQGNDVKQLQQYLNQNNCPVAATGAGSPGQESTYFGQKTQQAVICYQQKHNITPAQGYVGPQTRAHINARISPPQTAQTVSLPDAPPTISSSLPTQTRVTPRNRQAPSFTPTIIPEQPQAQQPHSLGDRHPDIKEAQQLLNERTSCPVATTGPGSPGQETTYFGSLTRQAILCYQRANNLTPTGTLSQSLLTTLRQEPQRQERQQEEGQQQFSQPLQPQAQQPHSLGDRHPDIKEAQQLLNERASCPVAVTGPGSPGQETTYFGSLTRQAILCYQRANNLTPTGTLSQSLLTTLRQEPQRQQQEEEQEEQDTQQDTNYQPIRDPYTYTRPKRSYKPPSV